MIIETELLPDLFIIVLNKNSFTIKSVQQIRT
jgi:hypothetical protein